jgi:dedicator of cytokinesis protein 3
MSGHDETCRSAVEILYSMIYAEYVLNGSFNVIETEILAKLDKLVSHVTVGIRSQLTFSFRVEP